MLKDSKILHEYPYDVSPGKALDILSRVKSGDIVFQTTDDRILKLRRVSKPDEAQKNLLSFLKIELPERLTPDRQM